MVAKSRSAKLKRRARYRQQATIDSAPLDRPTVKRKYDPEHYEVIKKLKRDQYYSNPDIKKRASSKRYTLKRESLKRARRERYHQSEKKRVLAKYHANREAMKAVAIKRYHGNREAIKAAAIQRYHANPQAMKAVSMQRYRMNRDSMNALALQRYHAMREPLKTAALKRYYAKRDLLKSQVLQRYRSKGEVLRKYQQRYNLKNRASITAKVLASRRCRRQHNTDLKENIKNRKVKSKTKLNLKKPSFLKGSFSHKHFNKLVSKLTDCGGLPARMLRAELLLKWGKQWRVKQVSKFKSSVRNWKEISCKILVGLQPFITESHVQDITPILGESLHTVSTEPFYSDAVYKPLPFDAQPIAFHDSPKHRTWHCNPDICDINTPLCIDRLHKICTLVLRSSPDDFPNVITKMNLCTSLARNPDRAGHPHSCYTENRCPSMLLFLRTLGPHFPRVRTILKYFYTIKKAVHHINAVDAAIYSSDYEYLAAIHEQMQEQGGSEYNIGNDSFRSEDDIIKKYRKSFEELKLKCSDTPIHPCMSCEKLCFRSQVTFVGNLRSVPNCTSWHDLIKFCTDNRLPRECICSLCLQKFRSGSMPSSCLLNNLFARPTPPEIRTLNPFEKMLIQRAKCFQVVVRMGTVGKKKVPAIHSLQKSIGRAFHLPLPLEQTLKTIPRPHEPLPTDLGLHILVRGVPTRAKKIWQSLVDVNKVYAALEWLKSNNPLYSSINVPSLQQLENDIYGDNQAFTGEDTETPTEQADTSLLMKISATDAFYEQYTICDLSENRPNKTACEIYQMRKSNAEPLRHFEDHFVDIKCFPDLYPYGDNGLHAEREQSLTPSEFAKLRIMSRHSQFRLNPQYLFYLMHEHDIRALQAGIYHKQNVIRTNEKLTAASCISAMEKGDIEQDLGVVFARLRNSSQYWMKFRSDIETMILYYGPVTFFLTLSPSEYVWDDLNTFLATVNGIQPGTKSTSALVAMDPVSTSRFIDHKFKAMMEFVTSDEHPLGEVVHWAFRREYQARGLQHFHIVLWVRNAPVIGESPPKEVAEFINSNVLCSLPDKQQFPTLYQRVTQYQKHYHNDYCMRRKKTKSGIKSVCRFGFPRTVTDSLKIHGVAESIAARRNLKSKSRLYEVVRTTDEICINDYNPAVMLAWNGNMDIQYIGESSGALSRYVTKYQTKCENSHTTDIEFIQNKCKSLNKVLWNLGMRALNSRECGILEACDAIMGLPLFGTDRDTFIKWVNVDMVRKRRMKPKNQLINSDPTSTDVYFPSLVDTHYPCRPAEMDETSLFEYAANYDIVKTRPVSDSTIYYEYPPYGYLKRRSSQCLIKHQIFDIRQQPEKYCFSMLLLFKPWRDISELRYGFPTYAEAFHHNLQIVNREMEMHHNMLVKMRCSKEHLESIVTQLTTDATINNPPNGTSEEDDHQINIMGEITEPDLQQMLNGLNSDQSRIFAHVLGAVADPTQPPLRHFVSGVGGTGKSFLIKVVTAYIDLKLGKRVAVAAPTGVAAYNVGGVTLHSLLRLPVEHNESSPEYKPLNDDALKLVRESFRDVALLIIDEISMVSNVTLLFVHLRLVEIFNTQHIEDGWFGNLNVIAFGDLLQLPPVRSNPPFCNVEKSVMDKCVKGVSGNINLWKQLFTYDELTINVRQQNDRDFADILGRIRVGCPSTDDIQILSSRVVKLKGKTINDRKHELAKYFHSSSTTLAILPQKKMVAEFNTAALSSLDSQPIHLKAIDSLECCDSMKRKIMKRLSALHDQSSETAGLDHVITLKIGCQVMIVRNLDVTIGLVNGTIATVLDICYDGDKAVSKLILQVSGKRHDIQRVKSKFEVITGGYVHRSQFPITLAYAITIHKCQGMTVPSCLLDIGNSLFTCGQSYVALSRVTSLDGLKLINLDPSNIKASSAAIHEYNRLREQYRSDLTPIPITNNHFRKVLDTSWCKFDKHLDKVQETSNLPVDTNPLLSHTLIPSFQNLDHTSCYSNATLQSIFHSDILLGKLLVEVNLQSPRPPGLGALVQLAQIYASQQSAPLSTMTLRSELGVPFNISEQQDACEFFTRLFHTSTAIEESFKITFHHKTECMRCNYTKQESQPDAVFRLHIPTTSSPKPTLADLIRSNSHSVSFPQDSICHHCRQIGTYKQSIELTNVSDLVMLQLMLWNGTNKLHNFTLPSIPSSKFSFNGGSYKMAAAIFHHGTSPTEGHYTAILRHPSSTKFIRADDTKITMDKWPRGGKDIYMIVLTKTK